MIINSNLLKIYNQLSQLDPNKISLITYNPTWNYLNYSQDGKTITLTAARTMFIPFSNNNYYVLTPEGYNDIMIKLKNLIADNLDEELITIVPGKLQFDIYASGTSKLFPYPVKISTIKLYDISNRLVINLMYGILYKRFNNPLRAYKKSIKASK